MILCGRSLLSQLLILLLDFWREYFPFLTRSFFTFTYLALVWQLGFPFAFWMDQLLFKFILKFFQFILMHQIVATTFYWILVSGAMTIPFLQRDQFRSRYVCVCFASDYILRVCLGRKISSDLGGVWN